MQQIKHEQLAKMNRSAFPKKYTYAGYLLVHTELNHQWRRKYFVLNNNFLLCGDDPYAERLAACIPLEGCNITQSLETYAFEITTHSSNQKSDHKHQKKKQKHKKKRKKYYFRAASPNMFSRWCEMIGRASTLCIKDIYRLRYKLGHSHSGKANVIAAKHRVTNEEFAIKVVDKRICDQQILQTQIQILKQLSNPYIVELCDVFETHKYLYFVMEFCRGGELFDKMANLDDDHYSEVDCCQIMHQIANGVQYMHDIGIVLRDLKPQNILCIEDSIKKVKIADYGIASAITTDDAITDVSTTAPEILGHESYDHCVDYWSLGVIMHILICGYPPFDDYGDDDISISIINDELEFEAQDWNHVSEDTKNLVQRLLAKDPKLRANCNDIIKNVWKVEVSNIGFKNAHHKLKATIIKRKFGRRASYDAIDAKLHNDNKVSKIIQSPETNVEDHKEQNVLENESKTQSLNKQCLSLHRFSSKDICDKIKWWIYNDINYKENLSETMKILEKRTLDGTKMSNLTTDDIKAMIYKDFIEIFSAETLNIMFNCFNQWKTEIEDDITSKSAAEIGYILYSFPLNKLLDKIMEDDINGLRFIEYFENNNQFIKKSTGWKKPEIHQIEAILFRHKTYTKQAFIDNMDNIMNDKYGETLPETVKQQIKNTILQFDVEILHFKIEHQMEIQSFSDAVINIVDNLIAYNEECKKNNESTAYFEDDFVKQIYMFIADCFIVNNHELNQNNISLNKQSQWICYNCSNFNVHKYIGSKMRNDLSICSLCGTHQRDVIIMKLRNYDTFVMVNDINENDEDVKHDDVDSLIQTATEHPSFDLQCPNRNDNKPCPSLLRLAKNLIIYKRWLYTVSQKTNGNIDLNKTIQIDIAESIDDEQYRNVFIKSAQNIKQIHDKDLELIMKMLQNNADDIGNHPTFLKLRPKAFKEIIKMHTNIKLGIIWKLRREILKSLKRRAQTQQFGQFLSSVEMDIINQDYYHISKTHINHGNKSTIKNAFRFFETVVHYEDVGTEITECRSCARRERRINIMNTTNAADTKEKHKSMSSDDKDIWSLQQYYNQSQLDIIHSYLAHSNWKYFIQRYSEQHEHEVDEEEAIESIPSVNKSKYVTDSYGFGVDHCYPYLSDKYCSIHDELLCNTLHSLSETLFQNLLTKAIKIHKIALGENYKDQLFCKYFNIEYNIIRNDPIGLQHILALILYTDLSGFCRIFRTTYRRMDKETTDEEVTKRHRELYHYARALFEAVEFFGNYMEPKLKVYHGLNKVMQFQQFSAYFYQPISTTTSFITAKQFSDDSGIILILKSGAKHFNDPTKIPKYLSVSWISDFPNEDEKMFYGAYVVFQIHDIIEAKTLQRHSKELSMFNKFQQILQNQKIEWNQDDEDQSKLIEALVELIEYEQNVDIDEKHESNDEYNTKYGKDLFHYFCTNKNRTKIEINNFKLLPKDIYNILFAESHSNDNAQTQRMSLIPIKKLFPFVQEMIFNDLEMSQFVMESNHYIEAVIEYIEYENVLNRTEMMMIKKIVFQSESQYDRKINTILKKSANKNDNKFSKLNWKIKYDFLLQEKHALSFEHR